MKNQPLLCYITDRVQFPGTEHEQRRSLLARIGEAAAANLDYVQLREKDLSVRALESLAREAVTVIRQAGSHTRLLINSRSDVAIASGADGVHLTSCDLAASEVRALFARTPASLSPAGAGFVIGVSCHSASEVRLAESHGADFAVLAPIFGKNATGAPGIGLAPLRSATRQGVPPDLRVEAGDNRCSIPVLALGGVTLENARECLDAGAAGIAAIRLFQFGNLQTVVRALRE